MSTIMDEWNRRTKEAIEEAKRREDATIPVIYKCKDCGYQWSRKLHVCRIDGGPWVRWSSLSTDQQTFTPNGIVEGLKRCTACEKLNSARVHRRMANHLEEQALKIMRNRKAK